MPTVTSSSSTSGTRVSIALFVCVSLTPLIGTEHGDQLEIFEDLLRKSYPKPQLNLDDVDYLRMDAYDVVHKMEYPSEEKIDEYDAFIYSGSGALHDDLVTAYAYSQHPQANLPTMM